MSPVTGLMFIPDGGDTSAKVNGFAGRSSSAATTDTFKEVSSVMIWFVGTAVNRGGLLDSFTVTVKLFVTLRCCALTAVGLKSVTATAMEYTPGPCASLGVQ